MYRLRSPCLSNVGLPCGWISQIPQGLNKFPLRHNWGNRLSHSTNFAASPPTKKGSSPSKNVRLTQNKPFKPKDSTANAGGPSQDKNFASQRRAHKIIDNLAHLSKRTTRSSSKYIEPKSKETKNRSGASSNRNRKIKRNRKLARAQKFQVRGKSVPVPGSSRHGRDKEDIASHYIDTRHVTPEGSFRHPVKQCIAPPKGSVPPLAHNLDRVLFSPGVHFLQDPRTRVYNFSPFLKNVIKYDDFDFDKIAQFTPASKDSEMLKQAQRHQKQFYSSTSSMTSMLSKFYMLLNNYSKFNVDRFGKIPFSGLGLKLPASLFVEPQGEFIMKKSGAGEQHEKKGEKDKKKEKVETKTVYSLSADKSCDSEILLSAMGHCLETLLTNPEKEFVKYLKQSDAETPPPVNAYNYSSFGSFLMRSQLDCFDERLPGNGTFDLKTRASVNIRHNSKDPNQGETDYQIFRLKGPFESYEREFVDLIRTGAMMKYMFQARIGQMDGIFIAYHNVNQIFGFEYLPLEEIDKLYYSDKSVSELTSTDPQHIANFVDRDKMPSVIADSQFKFSIEIWETLLKKHILKDLNDDQTPFRLVAQTRKHGARKCTVLDIYVVSMSKADVKEIQSISDRFPTSFRDTLSETQRVENFKNHVEEVERLNKSTLSHSSKLLSYTITMGENIFGDKCESYDHLPQSRPKSWKLSYHIIKNTNPSTVKFMSVLNEPLERLKQDLVEQVNPMRERRRNIKAVLESYEQLGSLRKKVWAPRDKARQVYRPKYPL
ncbi:uncharacterized protein LODBEIA_P03540 [Lodderomyces beijingensis]|uniref:Pet127p n=1 Tax=Lodderomyces beijingensis TaxID=1775926 RepID=A0ABP0ZD79_9ASCO